MRARYWLPSFGAGCGVTKLLPRLGSGTNLLRKFTAGALKRDAGMILPGNGVFDRGSVIARLSCEKSPDRIRLVSTVAVLVVGVPRSCVPCQPPKKNVLFFRIGPPIWAPN